MYNRAGGGCDSGWRAKPATPSGPFRCRFPTSKNVFVSTPPLERVLRPADGLALADALHQSDVIWCEGACGRCRAIFSSRASRSAPRPGSTYLDVGSGGRLDTRPGRHRCSRARAWRPPGGGAGGGAQILRAAESASAAVMDARSCARSKPARQRRSRALRRRPLFQQAPNEQIP